jgi:hypothetical protein
VIYQVKDQENPAQPINKLFDPVHEDVVTVVSNYPANDHTLDSASNTAGQFEDFLSLLGDKALSSGTCSYVKQSFTVPGNANPIRVNCLHYTADDVTIEDVTSNPDQCSKNNKTCP